MKSIKSKSRVENNHVGLSGKTEGLSLGLWHYWYFGSFDSVLWVRVLYMTGYLPASLACAIRYE